jgi:respiratory nitrate reductase gamma subunit
MNVLLWGVLPYVMMVILIGGLIWRYRYDQFGWTTRSSQLYESRLLRIGSPLFHFGILVVIIGHFGGLEIPKSWTEAVGISEGMYHFNALLWGSLAGICTLVGILILIYRRRTTGPVFMATTKNDKAMYVVLVAAIVAGLATTVLSVFGGHSDVTYRDTFPPGSARSSTFHPRSTRWRRPRWPSKFTPSSGCCCSRSGHSRAWCTPLPFRCTTCSAPTSSTAAVTTYPLLEPRRPTAAGLPSARGTAARKPENEEDDT